MPFRAEKGQRVRVEIQKHPIYGNSIELYLLDEKDSVSTAARFGMDSVFQSVHHYFFLDGGRTRVNVSHQKSNVYNSITYERRDREGYVIEGAQIQIVGKKLSKEVASKYYITYTDNHRKEFARYWKFSSKTDSVEHLRYTAIRDSNGTYIGGATYYFDELGEVVGFDSTYCSDMTVRNEEDPKYRMVEKSLTNLRGEVFTSKEAWRYDSLGNVNHYLFEDNSGDLSGHKWTSYQRDGKGRVNSEIVNTKEGVYSETYTKYGVISTTTKNPLEALRAFVQE